MGILRKLRVLITSRRLFNNWLQAGIKYYLIKLGIFKDNIAIKCGSKEYVLNPRAYSIIVNAYYDGLLRELLCSDNEVVGRLWGIVNLMIRDNDSLLRMPDGILLTLGSFDPLVLAETWLYKIHFLGFDLSGWFVLDVGAYIGDTALYYAKRGAFVVAIEPLPSNYNAMLRNIELNPDLKPRIIPINIAISSEDGFVELSYSAQLNGAASIYHTSKFKTKVKSMRLSTLIKEIANMGIDLSKFKIRVLKMDCKGCEYDVISEAEVLRLFDIIKIEYSGYLRNKTYHELKNTLEALGFKCRIWAHNEDALRIGLDKHGVLMCVKQGEVVR